MSIDKLKELELHDQNLDQININFPSNEIHMRIGIYNDDLQREEYIDVRFSDVEHLNLDKIDTFSDAEIYNHDISEQNDKFKIEFTFLFGFGKPALLSFIFKEVSFT